MFTSDSQGKLLAALAAAQPALANVKKRSENKFGGYMFAPLETVLDMINAAIRPHGLMFAQWAEAGVTPDTIGIVSQLDHVSGEWRRTPPLPMLVEDRKGMTHAQAIGSTITYGRRYQALAMFGIAAEGEDDDASDAGKGGAVGNERQAQLDAIKAGREAAKKYPRRGDPNHGVDDDKDPGYPPNADLDDMGI